MRLRFERLMESRAPRIAGSLEDARAGEDRTSLRGRAAGVKALAMVGFHQIAHCLRMQLKGGWLRIRAALQILLCVAALASSPILPGQINLAVAQSLEQDQLWRPFGQEHIRYSFLLDPLSLTDKQNILVFELASVVVIRIEKEGFCDRTLCLTVISTKCESQTCPSTSVLVSKAINLRSTVIINKLGGAHLLYFPLPNGSAATVIVARNFISTFHGLQMGSDQ
jgi:hypothetical protein